MEVEGLLYPYIPSVRDRHLVECFGDSTAEGTYYVPSLDIL